MGRVYLGRSDVGRTVAVKVVQREFAAEPEFRRRFAREVDAARRVGGQWTAAVIDADTQAPVPWVATQYVPGPSLHEVVATDFGPLPEVFVRVLAGGLAHALTDIHAAGLVHRDLKPGNILITVDGPRVIDFGITRALETLGERPVLRDTVEVRLLLRRGRRAGGRRPGGCVAAGETPGSTGQPRRAVARPRASAFAFASAGPRRRAADPDGTVVCRPGSCRPGSGRRGSCSPGSSSPGSRRPGSSGSDRSGVQPCGGAAAARLHAGSVPRRGRRFGRARPAHSATRSVPPPGDRSTTAHRSGRGRGTGYRLDRQHPAPRGHHCRARRPFSPHRWPAPAAHVWVRSWVAC
uniref:protein kinase domain-containing protein n=1 Tax=Streptomyces boluensis TaxID=1775135 RepID=UPI0035E462E4